MSKQGNKSNLRTGDQSEPAISMREVHADLDEFNATKQTVNDLLNYKRTLIDIENSDFDKINEIKSKAISAINNLFNDIINTKKD
jgi:hypothetical protein